MTAFRCQLLMKQTKDRKADELLISMQFHSFFTSWACKNEDQDIDPVGSKWVRRGRRKGLSSGSSVRGGGVPGYSCARGFFPGEYVRCIT